MLAAAAPASGSCTGPVLAAAALAEGINRWIGAASLSNSLSASKKKKKRGFATHSSLAFLHLGPLTLLNVAENKSHPYASKDE